MALNLSEFQVQTHKFLIKRTTNFFFSNLETNLLKNTTFLGFIQKFSIIASVVRNELEAIFLLKLLIRSKNRNSREFNTNLIFVII